MTSPYLRKPPRKLDAALKERGLTRSDIGAVRSDSRDGDQRETALREAPDQVALRRARRMPSGSGWFVLSVAAIMVCAGLVVAIALPDERIARDPDPSMLEIAPASGPPPAAEGEPSGALPADDDMPTVPQAGLLQPLE